MKTHNARPHVRERAPAATAVPPAAGHIIPLSRASRTERAEIEVARLPHDDRVIVGAFYLEPGAVALVKCVDASRHMLRQPPSWCVAELHLERLGQLAAQYRRPALVRLVDRRRGQRWEASLRDFTAHGFDVVRARDRQRGLPLDRWRQHAEGAVQLTFDDLRLAPAGAMEVRP